MPKAVLQKNLKMGHPRDSIGTFIFDLMTNFVISNRFVFSVFFAVKSYMVKSVMKNAGFECLNAPFF